MLPALGPQCIITTGRRRRWLVVVVVVGDDEYGREGMGLFRKDGCIVSFDSIAWRVFYPACCLFCLIGGRLDRRWMIGSEKIVDSSCASGLMVDRSELSVLVVNDLAVAMTRLLSLDDIASLDFIISSTTWRATDKTASNMPAEE